MTQCRGGRIFTGWVRDVTAGCGSQHRQSSNKYIAALLLPVWSQIAFQYYNGQQQVQSHNKLSLHRVTQGEKWCHRVWSVTSIITPTRGNNTQPKCSEKEVAQERIQSHANLLKVPCELALCHQAAQMDMRCSVTWHTAIHRLVWPASPSNCGRRVWFHSYTISVHQSDSRDSPVVPMKWQNAHQPCKWCKEGNAFMQQSYQRLSDGCVELKMDTSIARPSFCRWRG